MKAKVWIPIAALCAVVVGAGLTGFSDTPAPDKVLYGIHGGAGWNCVHKEPRTCADWEQTGDCYELESGYCSDATWRTSCRQFPKECQYLSYGVGGCSPLTAPCDGYYMKSVCVPHSSSECVFEGVSAHPCSSHPTGPVTMDWCAEV